MKKSNVKKAFSDLDVRNKYFMNLTFFLYGLPTENIKFKSFKIIIIIILSKNEAGYKLFLLICPASSTYIGMGKAERVPILACKGNASGFSLFRIYCRNTYTWRAAQYKCNRK